MPDYRYLIVGGGMAADAAVQGIRQVDAAGSIGLIGAEVDPPYNRPPLTKGLWKGDPIESIWRGTEKHRVDLHLGRKVVSLRAAENTVSDEKGAAYTYQKLLLATGGTPRELPLQDAPVIYFRNAQDYRDLHALADHCQRFAVIGAGFIGSEIAAALALNGKSVTMIFPEAGIGGRSYPADLAQFLNQYYKQKGVEVLAGDSVTEIEKRANEIVIRTKGRRELVADAVVAGLGIQPNVKLAKEAKLKVDDGIVVDEYLRTSDPNIYAAGDVAEFYNAALGKRLRVEHEDNANTMGGMAGLNMAGKASAYRHLPFFYSDLFDLGYEAVGELDSQLETVADWKDPHREGVVYYLKDGRVRGVLLWNNWGQVDAARELIAEPGPFRAGDLKGRLPKPQA